jgi:hypothetical protein
MTDTIASTPKPPRMPPINLLASLRYPSVWISLFIDAIPVVMVLAYGWTALPLVLLYWLENLVIGVFTLLRMVVSSFAMGAAGLIVLFLGPFFVFHYGMFCAGHGTFLFALASFKGGAGDSITSEGIDFKPMDVAGMTQSAFALEPTLVWVLAIGVAWRLVLFFWHFLLRGDFTKTNPVTEMFSPYGRIVALHLGIFAGFGALVFLGQPLWGVLGLILGRVVFGWFGAAEDADKTRTHAKLQQGFAALKDGKILNGMSQNAFDQAVKDADQKDPSGKRREILERLRSRTGEGS